MFRPRPPQISSRYDAIRNLYKAEVLARERAELPRIERLSLLARSVHPDSAMVVASAPALALRKLLHGSIPSYDWR
jgi:hypothetical protein